MIADSLATTFLVCPVEKIQEIAHQNQVEFFIVFDDMSTIQSPSFPLVDIY
jgi:thiamine biosynthesis lipoprotein ApbE